MHLVLPILESSGASVAKDTGRSSAAIAHIATADIEFITALIAALILELTRVAGVGVAVVATTLRQVVARIQGLGNWSIGIVGCPCACV